MIIHRETVGCGGDGGGGGGKVGRCDGRGEDWRKGVMGWGGGSAENSVETKGNFFEFGDITTCRCVICGCRLGLGGRLENK